MPTQQIIEEAVKELNDFIGKSPETIYQLRDDNCFICGQPFDKSSQVKKLKELFISAISHAIVQDRQELMEKLDDSKYVTRKYGKLRCDEDNPMVLLKEIKDLIK